MEYLDFLGKDWEKSEDIILLGELTTLQIGNITVETMGDIADKHGRECQEIVCRIHRIASVMINDNYPIDCVSEITKLDKDVINTIMKYNNSSYRQRSNYVNNARKKYKKKDITLMQFTHELASFLAVLTHKILDEKKSPH
jgi:hypothetical protein